MKGDIVCFALMLIFSWLLMIGAFAGPLQFGGCEEMSRLRWLLGGELYCWLMEDVK